ncbi:MAG: hypothetical protein K6G26_12075 [Lachnospiraceae bacterium]|nr:hypothetical protein [Lachnospiraceae bacterium]
MNHIYRLITCGIIFIISIFIFSKNIREVDYSVETVKKAEEASFPILFVKQGDNLIDPMYGYTGNIDAKLVKEGISSVDDTGECAFYIKEYKKVIKKVTYEVIDIQNNKSVDGGIIRKFKTEDNYKVFSIAIKAELKEDKEYAVKNTLLTNEGQKIYYYHRIKKTGNKHFDDIVKFADNFHDATLDKEKSESIVPYIEPDGSMSTTDLSYVNINSSLKMITFAELKPEVISDIIINVRDISKDTAMIEFVYNVKSDTDSGEERYKVREGYRIRWTATRMYLLYYDRSMESIFDIGLFSLSANEFKLGITSDKNVNVIASEDKSKVCFTRDGVLYYFDVKKNKISKLYSFKQTNEDFLRDLYDENEIKTIRVDNNGNAYFMIYGYITKGDYEGRTAIILYKYYAEQNRIEEMVNIPLDVPFALIKEQINDFAYVNENDVFFFSIGNGIYSYSIPSASMSTIAEDVAIDDMVISKEGKFIAWQTLEDNYSKINIMTLNNYKQSTMETEEDKYIKILGVIGKNIIYGYSDKNKEVKKLDGSSIIPVSLVNIAGIDKKVVKEYVPENSFVIAASVSGNKIMLDRVVAESSGRYIETEQDCIFGNVQDEDEEFGITSRATEKTMTDYYLYMPDSIKVKETPKEGTVKRTVTKGETTVRVFDNLESEAFYYVYAFHGIETGYASAYEAMARANERMGEVMDNRGHIIWERGKTSKNAKIKIKGQSSLSEDSAYACISMILENKGENVSIKKLKKENGSFADILDKYIDGASVDYSKAGIDYLTYSISKKRPVIAMMSGNRAVLIVGFDASTITYYDPVAESENVISKEEAEVKFGAVGNIYIGYVD